MGNKNSYISVLGKQFREWLHLTQEQFAQEIGVTYSTVTPRGNDKRVPQPLLVQRISEL